MPSCTTRFVPVLFERTDAPWVPELVRGQTFYCLDTESGYQALYDALLGQSGIEPRPLGTPRRRPRPRAEPLAFGAPPPTDPAAAPPPGSPSPAALSLWREKLAFLLAEEAKLADPEQTFAIVRRIAECRAKIRELGGTA